MRKAAIFVYPSINQVNVYKVGMKRRSYQNVSQRSMIRAIGLIRCADKAELDVILEQELPRVGIYFTCSSKES